MSLMHRFHPPRRATRPAAAPPPPVDQFGAPVSFEPALWLVCFVPGLRRQFWHRLVHDTHKHVLMLRPNPGGSWTLFEPWWTRLLVRTISAEQAVRYLRWAAMGDALLVEEDVPGRGSQFRGWSNCASLATFVLGRPYAIWSPHSLFRRLLAEERTSPLDLAGVFAEIRAAGPRDKASRERALMAMLTTRWAAPQAYVDVSEPSGQ